MKSLDCTGTQFLPLPEKYRSLKDQIQKKFLKNIYDNFDFQYYAKPPDSHETILRIKLMDFLKDHMFITYGSSPSKNNNQDQSKPNLHDFVICAEKRCIVIESVQESIINNVLKEAKASINLNQHFGDEIYEEIEQFNMKFKIEIKSNEFIDLTINPIICYLIRRYYYPSCYFKDKSFFTFGSQSNSIEQKFKNQMNDFFDVKKQNQLYSIHFFLRTFFKEIKEEEEKEEENNLLEFQSKEFMSLRSLYSKENISYDLVMHVESLHVFVMKTFKGISINHEINFCENCSHRCFNRCYGFIKKKGTVKSIIYEFLCNDTSKKMDANEINVLTLLNRLYQGICYLQSNNLIHRDLKPSNILIDHDLVPFIIDFETIRNIDQGLFTKDFFSNGYSAPEQGITESEVSFPTDIYSFGSILKDFVNKIHPDLSNSLQNLINICTKQDPKERATLDQIKNCIDDILNKFYFNDKFIITQIKKSNQPNEIIQLFTENIIFQLKYLNNNEINSVMIDHIIFFVIYNVFKSHNIPNIIYSVASNYIYNTDSKRSYNLGRKYLRMSGQQNHELSYALLGNFYITGEGVSFDSKKAIKYYTLAHQNNHNLSTQILGILSIFGKDYSTGVEFLEKSNHHNDNEMIDYILGIMHYQGIGIEKNYTKAKQYFEIANEKGFVLATVNLGTMYFLGRGVQQDFVKAKELFTKASKQNNIYAFYNLGIMYEKGLGDAVDYYTAKYYFEKASEGNIGCSNIRLGLLYYQGLGVERNYLKAKEYFEISAKDKNPEALLQLGQLYYEGNGVEKDYIKSKEYFELSAFEGYSEGCFRLGLQYYKGLGVPKDYKKSINYFSFSSQKDNLNACFYEALQYENEKGIECDDISKVIELYSKCIEKKEFEVIIKSSDGNYIENITKFNNYYYQAFNNLGLIYLTEFEDIDTSISYIKKAAFAEFPISQNNLGLFYNFFLNEKGTAKYLYERASKNKFALAEYNLGKLYEEEKEYEKAIEHYIKASEYDEISFIFKNEILDHDDDRLNISKAFIICLTNLKLTNHFLLQENNIKNAQKYFLKALMKPLLMLQSQSDDHSYCFKFEDNSTNIKDFILNCPIFNHEGKQNSKWKKIENNKTGKIIILNELSNDTNEIQTANDFNDISKINIETLQKIEICNKMESNFKTDRKMNKQDRMLHLNSSNVNSEKLINFLNDLINVSFSHKNEIKGEIEQIIDEMNEKLYSHPYFILFGRIEINKEKQLLDNIDENFYNGFDISLN